MATPVKPTAATPTPTPTPRPATPTARRPRPATPVTSPQHFLFTRDNYMWMLIGLALIFLSFLLMSGGKAENPAEFHYEEIYSFRRITLAPILMVLGFAIEAFAIMKKPKSTAPEKVEETAA